VKRRSRQRDRWSRFIGATPAVLRCFPDKPGFPLRYDNRPPTRLRSRYFIPTSCCINANWGSVSLFWRWI